MVMVVIVSGIIQPSHPELQLKLRVQSNNVVTTTTTTTTTTHQNHYDKRP